MENFNSTQIGNDFVESSAANVFFKKIKALSHVKYR
jgi:hypothetical protein